jgi:hypothetical protein
VALEDVVQPANLPPLLKNIAKNFVERFFKPQGHELVHREGLRLRDQVSSVDCWRTRCWFDFFVADPTQQVLEKASGADAHWTPATSAGEDGRVGADNTKEV